MPLTDVLGLLSVNADLDTEVVQAVFDKIFSGAIPPEQIKDFLVRLRDKGETPEEILGAVSSMRSQMRAIKSPDGTIDIVGTGGDRHGTFNISTAVSLVVSACGVPVAKHGNRAVTSLSGSSDVLQKLGVNLSPEWDILEKCINTIGLVFLFAPNHHPAMKHVAEVRKEIGTRTIFNLLGPLTNPANAKLHLIGAYSPTLLEPMAEVLNKLGSKKAWVVCGQDGLDEISTTAPTDVVEAKKGWISKRLVTPEEANIKRVELSALKGGSAEENAVAVQNLLKGEKGAFRDIVLINAAAALIVADKASDIQQGVEIATEAIDKGEAARKLASLVRLTNSSGEKK